MVGRSKSSHLAVVGTTICGHLSMTDGCRSDRGLTIANVVGSSGETVASNPAYTWSQTVDEVTFVMPVRLQMERRGFARAACRTQGW